MKRLIHIFRNVTSRTRFNNCGLTTELERAEIALHRVQSFLEKGADPNLIVNGLTALQRVALRENASIPAIDLLLDFGADPFLPIDYAGRRWHLSNVVKNPNIKDRLLLAEVHYKRIHGPQVRYGSSSISLNSTFPSKQLLRRR